MMQGRKWPCFIYFNLKFSIDLIPLSQEVVGVTVMGHPIKTTTPH